MHSRVAGMTVMPGGFSCRPGYGNMECAKHSFVEKVSRPWHRLRVLIKARLSKAL